MATRLTTVPINSRSVAQWKRRAASTGILIGLLIATGCGGASSGNQQLSPTFSLSGSAVTVQQGGTGQGTITVLPANGFSGNVQLSASGLPNGVTASFSPSSTPSTSKLTLAATSSVSAGSVSITVTGNSAALTATTTVTLTITPASSFTISLVPPAVVGRLANLQ